MELSSISLSFNSVALIMVGLVAFFLAIGIGVLSFFLRKLRTRNKKLSAQLRTTAAHLDGSKTHVDQLETLVELVAAVMHETDLEKVGELCLRAAMRISGANAGVVYSYNKTSDEVNVVAEKGLSEQIDRRLNAHLMAATNPTAAFVNSVYFGSYQDYLRQRLVAEDDKVQAKNIAILPLVGSARADLCMHLFWYDAVETPDLVRYILEDLRCVVWNNLEHLLASSVLSENLVVVNARLSAVKNVMENLGFEFRTALQNLVGAAEVLKVSCADSMQKKMADIVFDNGLELDEVMSQVIEFSQLDESSVALLKEDVNVRSLVSKMLSLFRARAEGKDISLSASVDARVPMTVICDGGRIRQVLVNLLGMAFRYSLQAKIVINVTAQVSEGEHLMLRFGISDTGLGFSKAKLHQIFSGIITSDSCDKSDFRKAGIALAVTKRLVEVMGGEIDVEPGDTHGSSFWFTLPAHTKKMSLEMQQVETVDVPVSQIGPKSAEGAPSASDLAVWNRVELLERLGGDKDILSHLKALFDSTTPERIVALRQASVRRDWDVMEKVSHELKGVAQNLIMSRFLESLISLRENISTHESEEELARKISVVEQAFEKARSERV